METILKTADTVFFDCPHCNRQHIPIERATADNNFNCPFCGKMVEVETDEPAAKPKKFNFFDWLTHKKQPKNPSSETQQLPEVDEKGNQVDPRYNERNAQTTKIVEDLHFIYDQGKNDKVIQAALLNPMFPSDLITHILQSLKKSYLYHKALRHPNCPKETIVNLMKKNKGKDNELTRMAIWSPHCPATILGDYLEQYLKGQDNETIRLASMSPDIPLHLARKILELNRNDTVSFNVAKNTASPKDAVGDWEIATGRMKDTWKIKQHNENKARWLAEEIKRIQTQNEQKAEQAQKDRDKAILDRMKEQDESLGSKRIEIEQP